MRAVRNIAVFVALATAGCNDKATPSSPTTGCPNASECGECVGELRAWMRALVEEGNEPVVASRRGLELVTVVPTQPTTRLHLAPMITIGKDVVEFNGGVVAITAELARSSSTAASILMALHDGLMKLRRAMCTHDSARNGTPWEVMVQVDATTPWRVVRSVVTTAEASGVQSVVFVVLKPSAVAKPGPTSIDARIELIEAELRSVPFDLAPRGATADHPFELTYGRCRAAYEGILATVGKGEAAFDRYLVDGLPDAIAGCGCNVDVEAFKALHWWWSGRRTFPNGEIHVGVRVPLTGEAARTPISVEETTPWSIAHQRVLATVRKPGAFFLTYPGDPRASLGTAPRKTTDVCRPAPETEGSRALVLAPRPGK